MIKKIFKIIIAVTGSLILLFGILGGVKELSSESADPTGLILAVIFIGLGLISLYAAVLKKKFTLTRQLKPENRLGHPEIIKNITPTEKKQINHEHSPWQRTFLVVSGSIELFFMIFVIIISLMFGAAGFVSGEMGTMIGFFMFASATGAGVVISIKSFVLWGFFKKKQWAPSLNLTLMGILIIIFLFSMAWPLIIYCGFSGWCSYFLIKHRS